MRVISTRTHGVLDYLTGLLLIVVPYLLGFADGTAAQYVPQALGVLLLGSSIMTDYELGLMRMIPMPVHLTMDIAMGVLLAASPWLFGFADRVFWPHLLVGLFEIAAGLMTRTTPDAVAGDVARNR
ncbi:SPW repeat domain-containing protein [Sabulicella rubraurantiaca]|uniref:SPW repeat domain-containing protein n=1 Tax=Sabulicella rubraurantiaca TaxID=2811429 RepID=UPI001A975DEA|nr:SPW repeat protein [Sabulicella rubraurantiaca]